MERLNQLVTRLTILGLIALAIWVGRARIAKEALICNLESYIGAKVDAPQLSLHADDSSVFLSEVEIADPLRDRHNLLQFGAASLNVDFEQLKGRRVVIEDGRISDIKFGAARTRSGRLKSRLGDRPSMFDEQDRIGETFVGKLSGPSGDGGSAAQRWRNRLALELDASRSDEDYSFLIVPLLNEKVQQWGKRFRDPAARLTEIEASLSGVEEVLAVPLQQHNPLRAGDRLADAYDALKTSKQSLSAIAAEIAEYETLSQRDALELSQAQAKDRQRLLSVDSVGQQEFDSELISEMLLGDLQRQLVGDAIERFQQFRSAIPDPARDFRQVSRGRDFLFGAEKVSGLEIRRLQIDGETDFANNHFRFAGEVRNVVSHPSSQDPPIEFDLRALGDPQVAVSGTIDQQRGIETIELTGYTIPQPAFTLGNRQAILISLASDSRLHVDAKLRVNQLDQITGDVLLSFEGVLMHADHVHEAGGGQGTAARINETVSALNSFQVRSTIGGTISQPTSEFVSDLGPRIATSLEIVLRDVQQLALKKKQRKLNQAVDGELATFEQRLAEGLANLNQKWRVNLDRVNRLQQRLQVATGPAVERKSELR